MNNYHTVHWHIRLRSGNEQGINKLRSYLKSCETLTRHIQNPPQGIIQPYSDIFRTLCNACICRNLTYSKSWNIQNLSIIASQCIFRTLSYLQVYKNLQIFRSLTYLKPDTYLERFKMEFFAKAVLNYNYHSKVLHLRCLTGS